MEYTLKEESNTTSPTHTFTIHRSNTIGNKVVVFQAACAVPGWEAWGVDFPDPFFPDSDKQPKVPVTRSTMIDALVHCVDRASLRKPPVHDPDRMAWLLGRIAELDGETRHGCETPLSASKMIEMMGLEYDLANRNQRIKRLRVVDW